MTVKLRRGFEAEAEAYALEFRAERGISHHAPLDMFRLAALLEIPVLALSSLADEMQSSCYALLTARDGTPFSAVTLGMAMPLLEFLLTKNTLTCNVEKGKEEWGMGSRAGRCDTNNVPALRRGTRCKCVRWIRIAMQPQNKAKKTAKYRLGGKARSPCVGSIKWRVEGRCSRRLCRNYCGSAGRRRRSTAV